MNVPSVTTAQQINTLHEGLESLMHQGIEMAFQIGELLTVTKQELPHGEFGTWIAENLTFNARTAQRYMKLFENKEELQNCGTISEAYRMLGDGKNDTVSDFAGYDDDTWNSLCKLGVILEDMLAGETVTGFTHAGDSRKIPDTVTIQKHDEELARYEMTFFNDDGSSRIRSSGEPYMISTVMRYLAQYPNIPIKDVTWVYPGVPYFTAPRQLALETLNA